MDSPTVIIEFRPSMTSVVSEPWLKVASLMVAVFLELEHDAEDLKSSNDGVSMIKVQPQPVMAKDPMSKLPMFTVSEVMALPDMVTSPAVRSSKVPGWTRAMVRSPAVSVSIIASALDGPAPV